LLKIEKSLLGRMMCITGTNHAATHNRSPVSKGDCPMKRWIQSLVTLIAASFAAAAPAPAARADEMADWMAEMRRQNDEFNRQAQEDREAMDRFNREAQEAREAMDKFNREAQAERDARDNWNREVQEWRVNEQKQKEWDDWRDRLVGSPQTGSPAAGPKSTPPKAPAARPAPAPQVRPIVPAVRRQRLVYQNPAAFRRMVRQNQARVRRQIMQTRQQMMQARQNFPN
jgi:hypothetical protein